MAVQKIPQDSTMAIKLQKGVNASGHPVNVTRNYSCKATVVDQDIYDVAQAIVSLQKYSVATIERIDNANLVNA
ncbi:MAG: DUF1659 domain-containing protein [Smithella sp.]